MNQSNKVLDESRQGEVLMVEDAESNSRKKVYIESYGCQMNFSDSEIVASIMKDNGYDTTRNIELADAVFLNTCSIREKAEQTVRKRLSEFKNIKKSNPSMKIGVLGCMAERLKLKLLEEEKLVDMVVGPDAYRDLPALLKETDDGMKAVNVILSKEETYGDISPVRLDDKGVSGFISIMRGCDNMCTFCVVPFTRGRERSRNPETIISEVKDIFKAGYREVTLLGQNVDSYLWYGGGLKKDYNSLSEEEKKLSTNFAQLLGKVALAEPKLRIRFSTSHPKDMTDDVLHVMAKYDNICKYIHLPVQSGSTEVLERMNRGYSQEWYLKRIAKIREIMPDCAISTDVITGFCGETDEDHQQTLEVMKAVEYEFAYMFKYSERPNTLAHRKYSDDVTEEVKQKRLEDVINLQQKHSERRNKAWLGKVCEVLIEGNSKKSDQFYSGRNSQNTMVVFPKNANQPGDLVKVKIVDCTPATLIGEAL